MNDIFNSDYTDTLPEVLKNDNDILAFAQALSEQILKIIKLTQSIIIYANIDSVPERLLDLLAVDLKCEWYNNSYNIGSKRDLIKNCIKIHKYKGTKYSIEKAISSIYDNSVEEWYEYGGDAYKFMLSIAADDNPIGEEMYNFLLKQIDYYKNVRSHLDVLKINMRKQSIATTGTLMQLHQVICVSEYICLTDENDIALTDENDNILISEV